MTGASQGAGTPASPYGRYDAICVLMAAGRKVAWRWGGEQGTYTLDGLEVTVGALNTAAKRIAARPFHLAVKPGDPPSDMVVRPGRDHEDQELAA